MWKGDEWRTLRPTERRRIMGLPKGYVDAVAYEGDWAKTRQARNSLVGNSFHVPSAMMFFYVLFATLQPVASGPHRAMYGMMEARLRDHGGADGTE